MPDDQLTMIETGVTDLMTAFDVTAPPVPVEIMLQRPKAGMWKEINLSELSTAFINIKQRYSPRMSVARLLARNVCRSEWGTTRRLDTVGGTDDGLRALARAILEGQRTGPVKWCWLELDDRRVVDAFLTLARRKAEWIAERPTLRRAPRAQGSGPDEIETD